MTLRSTIAIIVGIIASHASAAVLQTQDGLRAACELPGTLADLRVDGKLVSQATGGLSLIDPRTGKPPEAGKFELTAQARSEAKRLVISGVVKAAGDQETVCQLQARIPVGGEGWLFWDDMTRSRPIRSGEGFVQSVYPLLCVTDSARQMGLAVALDPDPLQPATLSYDPGGKWVIVNWFFGFTPLARPELRMRAPFRIELYRVPPKWAFRSALDGYYRFHPKQFDWRAKYEGLWLFASGSESLPNPQHYAYDEGGPPPTPDIPRGIKTFPYSCTGDLIIPLPPEWGQPKNYDEMVERLGRWEKMPRLAFWDELSAYAVEDTVAHGGARSLCFEVTGKSSDREVRQAIDLNQKQTDPITVSVWSKAQDVTGAANADYSLWLDLEMADGTNQFGKVAPAAAGTHDWQELRLTVGADKPIRQLRLYLLFRGTHTGKVWFDDVTVTAASHPQQSLAKNGDFEFAEPPPQSVKLRDNVMFDENDHMRYASDTWGGADVAPASPINWLRYVLLVNPDQKNPADRPTASDTDFAMYDRIFTDFPQCAGAYLDGTSGCCTTTFDYRRDHFSCFRDPFQYLGTAYRPCASGMASMIRWVQAFQARYPGKLAFGNVWASTRMFPMCMALDVPGYESSRWYDLDYMDYYRAAAYHKPGLLLNYFRIGQQLDTREGGERFFRYATAYGLFPSIGRFTDEASEKFGDLQHRYVPVVKHLFRAGWEPLTYAESSDPNVRVQRFGSKLPMYFTLLNPGAVAKTVSLTIDTPALGVKARWAVDELNSATLVPAETAPLVLRRVTLGPDDVAVLRLSSGAAEDAALCRERAAECLQGAAYVYAQTPPTARAAVLAKQVMAISGQGNAVLTAKALDAVEQEIGALRVETVKLPDDLKRRSCLRELAEAERLLMEATLAALGFSIPSRGLVAPVDGRVSLPTIVAAPAPTAARQGDTPRVIGTRVWPGRLVELPPGPGTLPDHDLGCPPERVVTIATEIEFGAGLDRPVRLTRRDYGFFAPVCQLGVTADPGASRIVARITNTDQTPRAFAAEFTAPEGLALTPAQAKLELPAGKTQEVSVRVAYGPGLKSGTYPVKVAVRTAAGVVAEETTVLLVYVLPLEKGDLALAAEGGHVAVDSYFYAYSEKPINDGVVLPVNMPFNETAWASGESAEDHWAEIQWPEPRTVGRVLIYWNAENDTVWTSQHVLVQVKDKGAWKTVADLQPTGPEPVTECRFDPVGAQAVRLFQPKGGGPTTRPNLMWLREVAVYP